MSVTVEVYNQMQTTWAVLTVGAIGAAVLIGVFWFVKNLLRSKSGKVIDSVKSGHKQLLLAATPSHRANLFKVFPLVPGVLHTAKFDGQRMKQKRKVFYEAEKNKVALEVTDLTNVEGLSDEEKRQRLAVTQECLDYILEQNTQKVFIEDAVPLTLAVEDKVITTGVKGIGAMAIFEKLYKVNSLSNKIKALEQNPSFNDVAVYLKTLASQITVIDIDLLRNYFNSDWNQSDDESQKDLYWEMGYREKHKGDKSGIEKWIVIGGIGIACAGIAGGAVLAWLGK
jgi:hypothetical protein